ncbi:MAG: succinate dehydrogenase / fumarate reductase iron-sulfur subunit [Kiritimatiellia bacterium]|jgi:succinate dehydrogenase / fumarate reductase, iron-sulfur subunit
METNTMTIHLQVWKQARGEKNGKLVAYTVKDVSPHQSFLEMLDKLNDELIGRGEEPIAFESDCREGICGNCGLVISGIAHGPKKACTSCELRMREFKDGDTITVEPFRAGPFPIIKDLVVDRGAFDRVIAKGGYVSVNTGAAPEANLIAVSKDRAEAAMDAAACIGCGACVAACPNASAALFVGAKVAQYAHLPQGKAEADRRVMRMTKQMDDDGFGACSNHGECEAVCPKEISISNIAILRREYLKALIKS